MHTWLPDAHSKAPTPVSALLSGILLSVAMYGVIRFKIIVDANMGPSFTSNLLIIFGLLSLVIAAAFILVQKNYKRLLAYSSVEHMGIIALGFGFGGAIGVFGALFHILNHALVKPMMFFNAGNILEKFHSAEIADARGVMKLMPITGPLTMIGALAITGTPPFNMFLSEFMILSSGIKANLAASVIFIFLLILIFSGFIYNINKMLFSTPDKDSKPGEENKLGLATISVMTISVILLGFYLPSPLKALLVAATNIVNLN
jgi:hydrogenase-4 component F